MKGQASAPRTAAEIGREWAEDLLPPGPAWDGPNVRAFLHGLAGPRERLEGDVAALCSEICPATSDQLLADYRALLGEDPLGRDQGDLTDSEWRYVLQSRWVGRGDQRPAFYIALAQSWGIDITIDEPEPPVCGPTICGEKECGRASLRFIWIVNLPTGVKRSVCGLPQSGLLEAAQNDTNVYARLQAVFRQLKPADTEVFFRHDGVWIDG